MTDFDLIPECPTCRGQGRIHEGERPPLSNPPSRRNIAASRIIDGETCPTCEGSGNVTPPPPLSPDGVHSRPAGHALTSSLELVGEKFPLLRERIASLFESDPVFRELCEDYEACALAHGRRVFGDALRREYAGLRLRLETELLGYLNDPDERSARKN